MKAKATVRLRFAAKEQLDMVLNATKPEAENQTSRRAQTILEKEDQSLVLSVEAGDTIALRASLNAYLRWTSAILDVLDVLKMQYPEKQIRRSKKMLINGLANRCADGWIKSE